LTASSQNISLPVLKIPEFPDEQKQTKPLLGRRLQRHCHGTPSIVDTKAIAEEAFIYGLPIVMNYAVMNEFVLDKNSGQYKAPFNSTSNEARVFTYEDTAVVTPNSDSTYWYAVAVSETNG